MASLTQRAGVSFGYWSKKSTDDEYLAALKFPSGSIIYDKMRRSDPQINAVLQAIFSPITAASWVVEPADETPQAEEVAKFVEANLFPAKRDIDAEQVYSTPWTEILRNILLFVPFGYMVIEKTYAVQDGKVVIADLGPRLPKTISEFQYDKIGNNLVNVRQKVAGKTFDIPPEKVIVFTFNKEGANAVGIALLRPLYKPWSIKEDLEKIQAIMFERYGVGTPVGNAGPNAKPGEEAFSEMETALENIASNESGYVVLPDGQTIDLLAGGTATAPDIKSSIEYYDNQISIAWHAMFMQLGTTTSGNRALGETFMDFFLTTVQGIGDSIADTLNNDLIPELVQLNFPVVNFPRLKMLPIKVLNFDVIATLKKAGLITSTEETENRLRELVGINELEEGEFDEKPVVDEPVAENGEVDEDDLDTHVHPVKQFARRKFNESEIAFGLPEMELQLDKKQTSISATIIKLRDRQGRSISEQIADGKLPANVVVPHKKEMYTVLIEAYKDQRELGKTQAQKNAKKQGAKFADPPSAVNELLALTERMLSVEVEGASNKLKSMLLEEAVRLNRQGVIGNKLELALVDYMQNSISEVSWNQMAATAVNGGWGDGHISFVDSVSGQVQHQVYSAVLDDNTCEVCRGPDGQTHAVGDPDYIAPNPGCLGGDRCRCVNITFYKVD